MSNVDPRASPRHRPPLSIWSTLQSLRQRSARMTAVTPLGARADRIRSVIRIVRLGQTLARVSFSIVGTSRVGNAGKAACHKKQHARRMTCLNHLGPTRRRRTRGASPGNAQLPLSQLLLLGEPQSWMTCSRASQDTSTHTNTPLLWQSDTGSKSDYDAEAHTSDKAGATNL